jgi:NhaA family Na+:H+ antiporter
LNSFEEFIKKESSSGILLILATLAALICKNTALVDIYDTFLTTPVVLQFGLLKIDKDLLLWINDGLMAIFFFLIGLEVKREMVEGHLSTISQAMLPGVAALGGVAIPALVYAYFNLEGKGGNMDGWAIPTATDIAFAVGVLALLGPRIPVSLKIFLLALAIFDDLAAIIIIAVLYTVDLSVTSMVFAGSSLAILVIMNRMKVARQSAYIVVGIILWVSVLKSGVHATLAGVVLALTIPLESIDAKGQKFSMSERFEHSLHGWVALLILPLFAFVNAGVSLGGIDFDQMTAAVPMGIAMGLIVGKQVGVFGFSLVAVKLGLAKLPKGATWLQLYGVSLLTGIGFTMSLFIDSLAFTGEASRIFANTDKLAILFGSLVSGVLGFAVLKFAPAGKDNPASEQ